MTSYAVLPAIATFCTLALTFLVLKDSVDRKAFLFGLCNLAIIFWNISDLFIALIPQHSTTIWVYRISNVAGIALPVLLVRFVHCLTGTDLDLNSIANKMRWRPRAIKILDIAAVLGAILCLTPLVIADLQYKPFSEIRGTAYPFVAAVYIFGFLLAFIDLVQGLARCRKGSHERKQLIHFLIALIVGLIAVCIYLTGNLKLAPIYFSLEVLYVLLIAHIVKRHKFLNVQLFPYRYIAFIPCLL